MKISVVVPIYGVEAYIADCARSLLTQSWQDTEFVFVNDGTPDRSMEVLAGVIAEYPGREVVIVNQENKGLPQARKAGILKASGDYIMHVDSDDWLSPEAIEKLALKASETGADVIHYYVKKVRIDGREHTSKDKDYGNPSVYARQIVRFHSHGYMCNKLMKRELYENEIFFPRFNMHEDIILTCQLLFHANTLVLIKEALYNYRRDNPDSASRVKTSVRRVQSARNFLDLYEYWKGRDDSPVKNLEADLILRSAWIAFSIDRSIFTDYPFLEAAALSLPLMAGRKVLVLQQIILKLWLKFR